MICKIELMGNSVPMYVKPSEVQRIKIDRSDKQVGIVINDSTTWSPSHSTIADAIVTADRIMELLNDSEDL
jgi:hypothetical protein